MYHLSLIFLHFIHHQAYQYMYMHVIIFILNGFENKINERNLQITYKIYFLKFQPSTSHMDGDRLVKVHTFNSR